MTNRATAVAPSNIAFVKYWGSRDLERVIPTNPSISMTLTRCHSRCTVEHRDGDGPGEVLLRGADGALAPAGDAFARPVLRHLERLRELAGRTGSFRVATENSFPAAAGLASSASGFAALTVAGVHALELERDATELSVLARLSGSGSAARSVLGGYVEWPAGEGEEACHATGLAGPEHWDLRNVIAVVETGPKQVSSRDGHRRAGTSPHFARRLEVLPERLAAVRRAIAARDLADLGPRIEQDAVELHLVTMSSDPPIYYWKPATLAVMQRVRALRGQGASAWFTMDAGPNVHVICPPGDEEQVATALAEIPGVQRVIRDRVGAGPRIVADPVE